MVVYRPSRRRRIVLALLVLTSVTLVTLDLRGDQGGVLGTVRDGVRDVLAPVQDAVDAVVTPVGDWVDGVTSAGSLERENRRLREEVAELRNEQARAESVLRENEELRRLAGLSWVGDVESVVAEVVEGPVGNFQWTIGLDKGSDAGLAEGMPVVASAGLVGRVVSVSGSRATVRLLTDDASQVAVRLPDGQRGIVSGRSGRDTLALEMEADATVEVGEAVVTAGLENGLFPAGLPVGTVQSVRPDTDDVRAGGVVRPGVVPDRLQFVRVLRWAGG